MATDAILKISDGTTTVDLLSVQSGFHLEHWAPSIASYKGGGYFQQSSISDGRGIIGKAFDNVIESMDIVLRDDGPDSNIRVMQQLRRLLEAASDYWIADWNATPVWLEVRARGETNTRYATIVSARIDGDGAFFEQPFLTQKGAVTRDVTLLLERIHWVDTKPGDDTCQPVKIRGDLRRKSYAQRVLAKDPLAYFTLNETSGLVAANSSAIGSAMDGAYDATTVLDDAAFPAGGTAPFLTVTTGYIDIYSSKLNDLFLGTQGQVLLWFKIPAAIWADSLLHYLLIIQVDASNTFHITKTAANNTIEVSYTAGGTVMTVSHTYSGAEWSSILVTWNKLGASSLFLLRSRINGGDAKSLYNINITWTGNLNSTLCVVGNGVTSGTNALAGNLAHLAIWNATPGQTTALGGVTQNALPLAVDPTPPSTETDCDYTFIAGAQTYAKLSHIFTWDNSAGTFTTNLADATANSLPWNVFPSTPAASDQVLICVQTTNNPLPNGPFSNVIWNTTGGSGLTIVWEYWNSAWVAWPGGDSDDNTSAFTADGPHGFYFEPQSDWVATTVNGVTGYWIRARISSVSSPVTPAQATRIPYAANWPSFTVLNEDVGGDIPALIDANIHGASNGSSGVTNASRVICGLRSHSRGETFSSHLNLSDEQLPYGIAVTVGTLATFQDDLAAPSGRSVIYNPSGTAVAAVRAKLTFDGEAARQWHGEYRMFLRCQRDAGAVGDFKIYGKINFANTLTTPTVTVPSTDDWVVLDLGSVRISSVVGEGELSAGDIEIYVETVSDASTPNLIMYDLILIPTDEWAGDFEKSDSSTITKVHYLAVGSVNADKYKLRARIKEVLGDAVLEIWKAIFPDSMFLQANADQSMWMILMDADKQSNPFYPAKIQVVKKQRYLSARADR